MKNFLKASMLTLIMSAGICFSSESTCAYDDEIDCMICSFHRVDRGACSGTGSDCPWSSCGGGHHQ